MKNLKVIKKVLKSPCYRCNGTGRIFIKLGRVCGQYYNERVEKCLVCKGTGQYKENFYIHIYKGQAFNGDTLK